MSGYFGDRLYEAVQEIGVPLAMGLDPHLDRFPKSLRRLFEDKRGEEYFEAAAEAVVEFNAMAIEAARGKVAAIKPQFAFYEQLGSSGMAALEATWAAAKAKPERHPLDPCRLFCKSQCGGHSGWVLPPPKSCTKCRPDPTRVPEMIRDRVFDHF